MAAEWETIELAGDGEIVVHYRADGERVTLSFLSSRSDPCGPVLVTIEFPRAHAEAIHRDLGRALAAGRAAAGGAD